MFGTLAGKLILFENTFASTKELPLGGSLFELFV